MTPSYVHGYDQRENIRLQDQASTLVELLHSDTSYPPGSWVLEAGCGVGAQTITLASNSPGALITSIDITEMIEGVRESAINTRMITAEVFDRGVMDLYRTAKPDGVFCYTFFKAVAEK